MTRDVFPIFFIRVSFVIMMEPFSRNFRRLIRKKIHFQLNKNEVKKALSEEKKKKQYYYGKKEKKAKEVKKKKE